jgi:hypothetical protein
MRVIRDHVTREEVIRSYVESLGDHPKPATCGHLKTGHSE